MNSDNSAISGSTYLVFESLARIGVYIDKPRIIANPKITFFIFSPPVKWLSN